MSLLTASFVFWAVSLIMFTIYKIDSINLKRLQISQENGLTGIFVTLLCVIAMAYLITSAMVIKDVYFKMPTYILHVTFFLRIARKFEFIQEEYRKKYF